MHSSATELIKDKTWTKKDNFLANGKSLNQFDILHWNYASYDDFNLSTHKFSTISAASYYQLGKQVPMWKIVINPSWAFFNSYVLRRGFLDGLNGFIIAI